MSADLEARVQAAMAPLGLTPYLQSHQYVQHDVEACLQAKRNILAMVRERWSAETYPVLLNPDDAIHPMSILGRILCDSGGPLNDAWSRFTAMDFTNGREFEQPYFTLHQGEATEMLEDRRGTVVRPADQAPLGRRLTFPST